LNKLENNPLAQHGTLVELANKRLLRLLDTVRLKKEGNLFFSSVIPHLIDNNLFSYSTNTLNNKYHDQRVFDFVGTGTSTFLVTSRVLVINSAPS